MTYQDTVNWMFKQLPIYQNQGKIAYKADLSNTILLASHLKNPHYQFKSIHIAGTNGKGSTSHMLASVLQEAGCKVGLYTSPHLKDFRERIKINGQMVSEQFVTDFIAENKSFFESHQLSFFEMTVGMAFDYFAKEQVDIAIVEVGLGGRLDSTNIITPLVSVITNIGLDHIQILGNTLEAIAIEKAGIIKPNVPVVIGETQSETKSIFVEVAKKNNSSISFADKEVHESFDSDLKGKYQKLNMKTVIQTLKQLPKDSFQISAEDLKIGLLNVIKNTGLRGRWEILQDHPKVICDVAHNKEGLGYVVKQIKEENYNNLHIVFGVVNDKDLNSIVPLMPQNATYYFCKPNIERGLDAKKLHEVFNDFGFIGNAYTSVSEALTKAKSIANPDDLIYVGGSTFVVAEIV